MATYRQRHAMSRYFAVTEAVIEKCQQDYRTGRDLGQSIPDMSATKAAVIVAESLEADRLISTPPGELLEHPFGPLSDWGLAVLAEIFFGVANEARTMKNVPKERQREVRALAFEVLEQALDSPTASPLVWYEDIYFEVAQEYRMKGDRRAIQLLKRGLAHDLLHQEGINAGNLLRELAEVHLWLDELDQGLSMFAALLQNDPADIWAYNVIAITFDGFGLADLGLEATQRGLELIAATGDPENLRDQLVRSLGNMQNSEKRGREAEVDPAVLADFRAALALDFDAGHHQPVTELCRKLVPDLDHVPVKRPPEMPDLPPPDALDQGRRPIQADQNLGRNDPCWCGSGKKYKRCHMRSDRGRQP